MNKNWEIAPVATRKIAVIAITTIAFIVPLQLYALYLVISRFAQQITTMDPFAVLDSGIGEITLPVWQRFISGFTTSFAASMGTLAIIAATRLVIPYRNRSLKMVRLGGFSHVILSLATLLGVAIGNREANASSLGAVISALWVLPVLIMSFNPMVRAWSVQFTPPPPVMPDVK